jgi:geranylgeranyl reductase family protein
MSVMESWDIIVVGGGPSGLSTALHLVQQDPSWAGRVLVLEKARYPRHKLCGGGITDYGIKVLTGLGLDLYQLPYVRIEDMHVVRGRQLLRLPRGFGLHVIRRDELDAWLADHAALRGVTIHQGESVEAVTPHESGVTVQTDHGSYEARTLVVADGSNGTVRRKLGMDDTPRVARALELLMPAEDEASLALVRDGVAVFDFTPSPAGLQGYYWDFPCMVNGRPHVNRGVYDARTVPERPRADLKAILSDYLAVRGLDLADYELMGHPIRWYEPEARAALPHVLLVGDAAGADPLLGEGIAFALAYGGIAAGAIVDAFARQDFGYADYGARVLASEYGQILAYRVAQAKQLYRHRYPALVPSFMPAMGAASAR